ncbi:MAG: hypothetical protein H6695_20460 [Deferribacteres bacterium]|nr:hypothetical protein [Deferribacteres bacterium]
MDTTVDSNLKNAKSTKIAKQEPQMLDAAQFNGIMQIRDILLGDHISKWENRIANAERDLQAAFQQTDAKLAEMEKRIDAFVSTAEKKLTDLEEKSAKFTQQAESRLKQMDERISEADKNLKEELETNLMDLEQENTDLRAMVDEFKAELKKNIDDMKGDKLDRKALSATLAKVAESLQEGED